MSAPPRSANANLFLAILLVSGWTLALWLWKDTPDAVPPPPPPRAEEPLARIFREWSAKPELDGAAVGFCLLDENGNTIFASPLAGTALCPASSLKTVTTGAAFALLGPEFRFETQLAGNAPLDAAGGIDGDLVLVGGGDPTLTQADLAQLARAAVTAGLKSVRGWLRVDASVFPEHPMNDFWNWGDIGNAYGAGAFGVNVEHNRLTIRFASGDPGTPAKLLGSEPELPDVQWVNHVVAGAAGSGDEVVVYSEPYGRTITLRGTVPAGESGFVVHGALPDPPAFAAGLLRAQLDAAGVSFGENPGPFPVTARTPLAVHRSAALPEIIDHLHRVSDNLEAQCFFLTLGRRQNADPAETVRAHWEKAGVALVGLRQLDGSGLARANTIRPLDLARVNFAARRGPHGQRFYASLSTYLDGAVRAKLGAMSGVKTEVGFLRTAAGRELTFALMANGLPTGFDFWTPRKELLAAVQATDE